MEESTNSSFRNPLELRILVGIACITATIILVGWIAINENARMEAFTTRSEARSIEVGARLFENNCVSCHGSEGLGLAGVAPALNNPHFFGFNFFADIDNETAVVQSQLDAATDPAQREQLQARLDELAAERIALEEQILYDYSGETVAVDEQIVALDAEIAEALPEVGGGDQLATYVSRREVDELAPLLAECSDITTRGAPPEPVAEVTPEPTPEVVAEATAEAADAEAVAEAAAPEVAEECQPSEPVAAVAAVETTTAETTAATAEGTAEAEAVEIATETAVEAATPEPAENAEAQAEAQAEATAEAEAEATEAPVEEGMTVENLLVKYPLLTPEEAQRLIELNEAITAFDTAIEPYSDYLDQRNTLVAQRSRFQAVMDAQTEVETARVAQNEVNAQVAALGEVPAEGEEDPNAAQREELQPQVIAARQAFQDAEGVRGDAYDELVAAGDILAYDPNGDSRVVQLGWSGALEDLVEGTLIGGRPNSKSYWPQPMPAWSQQAGGPLRGDQIDALVSYIMNFNREFTIADVRNVNQFARVPVEGAGTNADAPGTTNLLEINETIATGLADGTFTEGDVTAGQAAFSDFGCAGCHVPPAVTGPSVIGLWGRAEANQDDRLTNSGEETAQGYVIHSIILPNDFVVPNFNSDIMPQDFSQRMSYQQLIDILAYIEDQD
jgi:mono/diheme cytochrome c family protein